jgi:DNA repair protein RecN (Recombination protein N)
LYQQYELLYESETAVESQLAEAERSLDRYSSLEERIAEELEKVQQARYLVEDAAGQLNRLADTISDDPERLQEIQQRLDLYNRLKIKYGVQNAADLLAIQRDFEQKVQQFSSISDQIQELERAVQAEEARLAEEAQAIEAERLAGADRLQSQVEEALQAVALQGATFQVHVKRAKAEAQQPALTLDREPVRLHPHGVNTVQFLISTNEGFAPEPLAKVASGGEISRVMLAIKTALAEKLQLAVLIFDEIDTGISGEVALRVGRVMERLAEHHQLITITHLPQIASCHGRHFVIYKASHEGQVVSDVRQLSPQERVHEIAKIMSGEQPSAAAHESAKELLNQSRQQLSS